MIDFVIDEIKNKIKKKTELTVSVGCAPTRLLAKMSSEENKPDGKFIL